MIHFSSLTSSYRLPIQLQAKGWELRFATTLSTVEVPRPADIPEEMLPTNGDFWFWIPLDNDRDIFGLIDVSHHNWPTMPLIRSLQSSLAYLAQVYSQDGTGTPLQDLSEFTSRFLSLATSLDEELPAYASNCFAGQLMLLHANGEVEVSNLGTLGPWARGPEEDWRLVRLAGNSGYQYCAPKPEADAGDTPQPPLPVDAADKFRVEAGTELFFCTDGVYENGRSGRPRGVWWDRGVREALDQTSRLADMDACLDQVEEQLQAAYPPGNPVAWPEDDTTMLLVRRMDS